MTHTEKRLNDIRYKIRQVKENINNHFRHPMEIIITLTIIETTLENNLFELKSKTNF